MADDSSDLTLTDPPYGVGVAYDEFSDTSANVKALVERTFPEILRVSKRVLLTPGNKNERFYPQPTWTLAWVCPAGTGRNPWGFTCWHPILAYGKDPYLANGKGSRPDMIYGVEASEKNGHPCPKPIDVWTDILIRGSVLDTDIIFDPFMGSGTTLVAAKRTGRKAIGVEISEQYCETAALRLL